MSEIQAMTDNALPALRKQDKRAQAHSARFTPLRSHVVARKQPRDKGSAPILSRIVPVRRLPS